MMNQAIKQLPFYFLASVSSLVFSLEVTAADINLPPNQSTVLANTDAKTINMLCEVHVASKQSVAIKIINGNGSFNGTSFKRGDSMVSSLYDMQHIPISAESGNESASH